MLYLCLDDHQRLNLIKDALFVIMKRDSTKDLPRVQEDVHASAKELGDKFIHPLLCNMQ